MTKDKGAALDAALTGMFDKLESRGVPEHLRRVVDQLDESARAEEAAAAAVEDEAVRPSPSPSSSPEP